MGSRRVSANALLALAVLALVASVPVAAARHAECGAPDGSILLDGLYVWLHPGCEGVALVPKGVWCEDTVHTDVRSVTVVVLHDGCYLVGVWLRP